MVKEREPFIEGERGKCMMDSTFLSRRSQSTPLIIIQRESVKEKKEEVIREKKTGPK